MMALNIEGARHEISELESSNKILSQADHEKLKLLKYEVYWLNHFKDFL